MSTTPTNGGANEPGTTTPGTNGAPANGPTRAAPGRPVPGRPIPGRPGATRAIPGRPTAPAGTATREAPDWDLVRKRNNVEKLKFEKFPLKLADELEELGERDYLDISEEDMVRFQWYGLYHDKPKVGLMMLRIKVPSGWLTPAQVRVIGELSEKFGRGYAELSTRQTLQLHWLRIKDLPEIFAALASVGMTSKGGCGDAVRNTTGCPVAGIEPNELFDCRDELREMVDYFVTHDEYLDLPRKHKITMATCADQCNAPEINCIAFVGTKQGDRLGYAVRVGGGLSSTPRIARDLGIFVERGKALEVARGILDVWRHDLKYRMSRAKARLKFLVDDYGAEGVRKAVEERLGHKLEDLAAPTGNGQRADHIGVHPQKQPGLSYLGVPVFAGQVNSDQLLQIAALAESYGGDIRLTRQQNFIMTGVPEGRVSEITDKLGALGFDLEAHRLRGSAIACTGQPLCNFAVAETKGKMKEIVERLETKFGSEVEMLSVGVDGCPHSCAHHWISDIGLQGTTGRGDGNTKLEAYEVYLRGGLGDDATIGRPVLRRVPAAEAVDVVERLVAGWIEHRQDSETFQQFARRASDEELVGIAGGDVAEAGGARSGGQR
jgi:sulfite reductase beta subunit-like hemoprotein